MTLLAGLLDVLLRGLGAVVLSAAVGGLVYVLVVLRPGAGTLAAAARVRALILIEGGALVVAGTTALLLLVVHPWALADEAGRWPLREFLGTEFGLAGLEWMVRAGRLTRPGGRLVFPLLCAAGGGLLLTDSHAMFSLKSEFLAEVSHAPMGLFGVIMAWGGWLELRLPPADRRIPGWTWAAAMTVIGLILLVYRET